MFDFRKLFDFRELAVYKKLFVYRKWILGLLITLLLTVIIPVFSIFVLVKSGHYDDLPTFQQLNIIESMQASGVYDAQNELIGKIFIQDRSSVPYNKISQHLLEILVAVEDKRYYSHSGVDYFSLLRVIFKSILLQDEAAGGGSTITQQLAKNLFPRIEISGFLFYPVNKTREMIIANRIETLYSKNEIITLYLNTVSFGLDIYGVESACQRFYSKSASEVNIQEAATIIGMLKATTYYNPILNPDNSLQRRNGVLQLLANTGIISEQEADSLVSTPFEVNSSETALSTAQYFQQQVKNKAREILKEQHPDRQFNLATDGLRIETTLDLKLQQYAEASMLEHMKSLQSLFIQQIKKDFWKNKQNIIDAEINKINPDNISDEAKKMSLFDYDGSKIKDLNTYDSIKYHLSFLQTGFLAVNPKSGGVKAWVGGIDFNYFPYDHVISERQVGSTIKPFIYASALERGVSPCDYFETEATSYTVRNEEWTPTNADTVSEELMTMEQALEKSVNTVSVKILQEAGLQNTIQLLRAAGIGAELEEVPSIALGSPSISLLEMIEAYTIFVNQGMRQPVYMIEKIKDIDGNILYSHSKEEPVQVISEKNAEIIRHFLQNVVNKGTGASMRYTFKIPNDLGGKTGTTQYGADGWFINISPQLIVGTWVGGNYPEIRFHGGRIAQGAKLALPINALFYQKLNENDNLKLLYTEKFNRLSDEALEDLTCDPFEKAVNVFETLFGRKKKKRNKDGQWEDEEEFIEEDEAYLEDSDFDELQDNKKKKKRKKKKGRK